MKIILCFSGSENKCIHLCLFPFLPLPSTVVLRLFVFNKLTWQKLRCICCLHKIMNCVCSFLCKILKDSMLTLGRAVVWFMETWSFACNKTPGWCGTRPEFAPCLQMLLSFVLAAILVWQLSEAGEAIFLWGSCSLNSSVQVACGSVPHVQGAD